jgi:hypothetical protein
MYRNCERYLSGAIKEEEFIVQAARDQQLIVQVLAVEQITGVARAQSTALTTIANAAAGGAIETGLEELSTAKTDLEARRSSSAKATSEAMAIPPIGPCTSNPIDTSSLPEGVTAAQATVKNDKCRGAAEAAKLTREAEEHYELIKQVVSRRGAASSEAEGKLASAAQASSEASAEIADRVVEIVKQYHAFDEIGMTCVVKLRTQSNPPEYCKALIEQMANTRAAQLRLEEDRLNAERIAAYRSTMDEQTQIHVVAVWSRLTPSFSADSLDKLATRAGITIADRHKQRLLDGRAEFSEFAAAFKRLPADQQAALAKAAEQP